MEFVKKRMKFVKKRLKVEDGVDRISNLPSEVTQHILEYLPLQDAVMTSFLSRHWRYQWAQVPQLILDYDCITCLLIERLKIKGSDKLSKYSSIVDNVLLRHIGTIRKFVLYIPQWFPISTDISGWIQFVTLNGVKELSLHDYRSSKTRLPSCLFSCVGLTHLSIENYYLPNPPPTFSGFPCLTSLNLEMVAVILEEHKAIQNIISSCPQLESLYLTVNQVDGKITIDAPKLQHLFIGGLVPCIHLEKSRNINTLSIKAMWVLKKEFNNFLYSLSNLETLILGEQFWQIRHFDLPKFTNDLGPLTTLKLIEVPLSCPRVVSLAVNLFASFPQLQNIEIEASEFPCVDCGLQFLTKFGIIPHEDWGDRLQTKQYNSLKCLKKVALVRWGSSHDLRLIKLLLGCSPVLQVMTIVLSSIGLEHKFKILSELLRFHRASTNAEVIFKSN